MNNIIKRKWNQNSMVIIEDLQGMAFQAESGGHTFQISGIDGEGNTVALSGTPAGVMLRSDGQDVTLTCSVSGGVVSATLPANAYVVPGRFGLTIFLTSDGQKTAIYAAVGTVGKTSSGTVAPPAGSDVVDLVNAIAAAVATIPASYTDLMAAMAPTYSSSGLYAVGSYAWDNGKLYRCTTPITTAETWTTAHWTLANLGSDLVALKSAFNASIMIENDELEIDSSMFVSGSFNVANNELTPIDNNKRIRTASHILIRGITKVAWECETGYSARIYSLDDDFNVLSTHGYDPSGSFDVESNGWYIAILLMHGSSTIQPSEASNLSVSFTYSSSSIMKFRKVLGSGEISNVSDLIDYENGWYGFGGSVGQAISGKPTNYTNIAGYFEVKKPNYNGNFTEIVLYDVNGNAWSVVYNTLNRVVYRDWVLLYGPLTNNISSLYGKTVAIIGDSISTNGSDGDIPNVPEIEVTDSDVGVQLKAYLTYYDVRDGLSLGNHTFTSEEIGTQVTFTPIAEDVGKKIGVPNNYNPSSTTVWWEVMMQKLGCKVIPVCWSGASITSHEGNTAQYKTSYAWHGAQIRKCGIRTPGAMTRTAPDVIIIYRGTNDFSHSPYTLLTDDFFSNYNWQYPESDSITGGYGYKEGLCLTIKKLRDAYPNAKIFLCTLNVFKRVSYSHFPTNNGINSLPQYNDAIREVADFMGCGVIEFDKDGITFENCYSEGYITDSSTTPTHPSDKGHKVMGLKAVADLKAHYSPME